MAQHDQTPHVHGSMDIRDQEKTFAGFLKITKWTLAVIFVVLVFMALANS